jgi:ADP-ribosylglycohydrolase
MAFIPHDYEERVYAGVLGKIIGVYVGRPFEGWTHDRVIRELGEIRYYVHERLNKPLIVTDDDISGTFSFLRAMPDYGNPADLTPEQIGQTWLNYLIEKHTILWWGGMGNSTEHTAYLRLKAGIKAPESGSMALNGRVVAEQIGAQIFIDGWGMIVPGDPERAADLARRAGSVSHDGEAIYGAQVVAAIEAQAFVEPSMDALLDTGMFVIPNDSLIYRLIADLRDWHGRYKSWYDCFYQIVSHYGYDKYGGNCHMVPNHALIILALLYCEDRFDQAMTIVNTAGWDTDCNSGNVGCIMGIKGGLAGLDVGPDFREPVADRLYLPTADGGRTVTDALAEAYEVVDIGRALAGQPAPRPKGGARYHFSLPGAVQGWIPDESIESRGVARVENVVTPGADGERCLAVHYHGVAEGRPARVLRETYPDYHHDPTHGYRMVASPTLYPGQTVTARLLADAGNGESVEVSLLVKAFGENDALFSVYGPAVTLAPGAGETVDWTVQVPVGCPIAWIGIEIASPRRADGTVYLERLTWSGAPDVLLGRPERGGRRWLDAWVQACDTFMADNSGHDYRMIQDEGNGMVIQGTREWADYTLRARLTPHLARSFGIAARVQGLRRYYALRLVSGGRAQLVRELDGTHVLAEIAYDWDLYQSYDLEMTVRGGEIVAAINGEALFHVLEADPLQGGAVGLLVEEGRVGCAGVAVMPAATA